LDLISKTLYLLVCYLYVNVRLRFFYFHRRLFTFFVVFMLTNWLVSWWVCQLINASQHIFVLTICAHWCKMFCTSTWCIYRFTKYAGVPKYVNTRPHYVASNDGANNTHHYTDYALQWPVHNEQRIISAWVSQKGSGLWIPI